MKINVNTTLHILWQKVEVALHFILFSIYINDLGVGLDPAKVHFYADDTIIYTVAPSLKVAMDSFTQAKVSGFIFILKDVFL